MALAHNLLKRCNECVSLIHQVPRTRPASTKTTGNPAAVFVDQYDSVQKTELSKCNAMQTSLWELLAHQRHYHPHTSSFSRVFETKLDKRETDHDMDELASLTYKSLFDQEVQRKMKSAPLAFAKPSTLFADDDMFSGVFAAAQ